MPFTGNVGLGINIPPLTTQVSQEEPDPDKIYELVRGAVEDNPYRNSENYSNAYYRNAFKVQGGPIMLYSVGFFGPANKDVAKYDVTVFVETPTFALEYPWYYHLCPCLATYFCSANVNVEGPYKVKFVFGSFEGTVLAAKDEIVYVTFNEPVPVLEDVWIGITFKLQGTEPTARLKFSRIIDNADIQTDYGNRTFQLLTGSCQMPVVRFLSY